MSSLIALHLLYQGRASHLNSKLTDSASLTFPRNLEFYLLNVGVIGGPSYQATFTWMGAGVENFGPHIFVAKKVTYPATSPLKKKK